jgi:hypothetical protein
MTGLDTEVDALISRMNPAFSSLCSSDAIAFLLGSSNHCSGCLTGLALGSTFSACSTNSLGTPSMSRRHQAKISQYSRRNSTSALSYTGSRFTAMEVVLFGSVGWTWISSNLGLHQKPDLAGIVRRRVAHCGQFRPSALCTQLSC